MNPKPKKLSLDQLDRMFSTEEQTVEYIEDITQEEFDKVMRVLLGGQPVDEETNACDEDDKEEN